MADGCAHVRSVIIVVLCLVVPVVIFLLFHFDRKESSTVLAPTFDNDGSEYKLIGDGVCDDEVNSVKYDYDGGDCCVETSARDLCQECRCPAHLIYKKIDCFSATPCARRLVLIGDGKCDLELNTLECFYDGGDCCLDGTESTCIKGIEFCIESEIGDGNCQDYNRGPKCNYDGKDCCPIPVEDGNNSYHVSAEGDCCICVYQGDFGQKEAICDLPLPPMFSGASFF